jgi:hypothetical protein
MDVVGIGDDVWREWAILRDQEEPVALLRFDARGDSTSSEREEIRRLRKENYELRRIRTVCVELLGEKHRRGLQNLVRSERVHRLPPRALRGRADLSDPGHVGVRLLPARHRPPLARAVEDERLVEKIRFDPDALRRDRRYGTTQPCAEP